MAHATGEFVAGARGGEAVKDAAPQAEKVPLQVTDPKDTPAQDSGKSAPSQVAEAPAVQSPMQAYADKYPDRQPELSPACTPTQREDEPQIVNSSLKRKFSFVDEPGQTPCKDPPASATKENGNEVKDALYWKLLS